jgi:hypothetical protein
MSKSQKFLDRRAFLKNGLLGAAGIGALSALPPALRGQQNVFTAPTGAAKSTGFITRTLGKTGVVLPIVSMGVMNSNNDNLIKAALDGGIVHLDTAHGYQRGTNEVVIGKVLQGRPRDSYFLATKVQGDPRDRQTGNFSPETSGEKFMEKFDLSLQRLGLEYVDLLYLHNVLTREAVLFEPLMKALAQIKKSGKARFIGVSTHGNEHGVIRAAIEGKIHDVVLTSYNFRQTNRAELDAAIADGVKAGLGFVAMKTMAGGRGRGADAVPVNVKAALKWALQNPHITTAIPGMTSFDQLEMNLQVAKDITLSAEEKTGLGLSAAAEGLYCQGCQQCLSQCPRGLPIPSLMRGFMYAYGYRNLGEARDLVAESGAGANPCADCGSCSVRCTMGFDVREKVTDISRLGSVPAEFFG